jgi:acetyltransferase-like isoleucine patch superfamily enzyme
LPQAEGGLRQRGLLGGRAPHLVSLVLRCARQYVSTGWSRLLSRWWGVSLGRQSAFCGTPIFRRHPTGEVVIGDAVTFRSAEWSNTIGLNRRCVISAGRNARVHIGNCCGFSATVIAASCSITIGDRVLCGANCTIVDTNRHPLDAIARARGFRGDMAPIIIEDDVWLGMNVVVLKGCRIGKGTVVAANSVVTRSLPGGVMAAGVPARVIRELRREDSAEPS